MNIANIITSWLAFRDRMCTLDRVAGSTVANQRQVAGVLVANLGNIEIADLRKSHLDLYAGERLLSCKPVTVSAELAVLRQVLNWAVDEQLLGARPRFPTISVPNIEKPLPGDEDYLWFLRTMSVHHANALEFMLLTGLAPHELERIHVGDFDPLQREIIIGGRADFAVKQESRRRRIPLNGRARSIWVTWTVGLIPTAAPFPRSDALQKAMRRHVLDSQDAPLAADGLTPKMMRKWFASKIASEQGEAVLQRLLGHAPGSPVTRRHYIRTNASQMETAVRDVCL
ncbi:site-specific integrase [Sphingomonas paeninsulae]|uniref:Site-specific integrase n=1 Tax=Sphingomonas paeninsulae TaxID=2319844 RepID=A0A494TEK9_SPHPE|nr:site-specific integrase [Sphingomonas paeninsulae]AYJ85744.1 site-specific integrase [Sphingomonas paeninsulae]